MKCFLEKQREELPFAIRVEADEKTRLDETTENHLFSILREALHNACKHSGANVFELFFEATLLQIRLRIRDDGSGGRVDPCQGGIGLQSMRERIHSLGGAIRFRSAEGRGFSITIDIPRKKT
ncbi:MAG: sensor histidine kinase [Verrucomicrobiales bacterium]